MRRGALCFLALLGTAAALDAAQTENGDEAAFSSAAPSQDAPALFSPADVPAAATAAAVASLAGGLDVVVNTGGRRQPVASVVTVNQALLADSAAPPPLLTLALPHGRSLRVRHRPDFAGATGTLAAPAASAAAAAAGAAPIPTVWVGDVEGAEGPTSSVTLILSDSGAVYGNVRFVAPSGAVRSYLITPVLKPGTATASIGADASAAAIAPHLDGAKHLVLRYRESKKPRRVAIPRPDGADEGSQSTAVDTTPPGRKAAPLPPLPSGEALEAAKEASEGPHTVPASEAVPDEALAAIAANVGVGGAAAFAAGEGGGEGGRRLQQTSNIRHDLLALFTAAAARRVGGVDAITNQIRVAVAMSNKAHLDSGTGVSYNLVAIRQVSYSERGNDPLDDLQGNKIPNALKWRNELGADLVTIFNDNNDVCGVAFVLDTPDSPNWAFSAVMRGCALGYTLAHEIGHNTGCNHNFDEQGSSSAGYNYGWRRCDLGASNNFQTIMSYGCTNEVFAAEIGMFSNPSRTVLPANVPAGDATRGHCARKIAETALGTSNYRASKTRGSLPISSLQAWRKCVDTPNYDDGQQVMVWDCHGGANQQWERLGDGSLRIPGTNKCLDVRNGGTSDGTVVQLYTCNGTPAQLWFADAVGRLHPYVAPDKCLDIPSANATNGQGLHMWTCRDVLNQKWTAPQVQPVWSPSGQAIKSRLNMFALDVFAYNYTDGAAVVMWPVNGQANQRWTADTSQRLRSLQNTNKCLAASNTNAGATVYIWDCQNGASQRWFADPLGRLRPYSAPSKCLDVRGADPAQGTVVQLWDCFDVPQQKFFM